MIIELQDEVDFAYSHMVKYKNTLPNNIISSFFKSPSPLGRLSGGQDIASPPERNPKEKATPIFSAFLNNFNIPSGFPTISESMVADDANKSPLRTSKNVLCLGGHTIVSCYLLRFYN